MNYTESLQITAKTAWATWYQCSEVATEATEAGIDWYMKTFFSEDSLRAYEIIGTIIGDLMIFAYQLGAKTREVTQSWVDAQVAEAQALPAAEPAPMVKLPKSVQNLDWATYRAALVQGFQVVCSVATLGFVALVMLAGLALRYRRQHA